MILMYYILMLQNKIDYCNIFYSMCKHNKIGNMDVSSTSFASYASSVCSVSSTERNIHTHSNYCLAICEYHHPELHGSTYNQYPYLKNTFLLTIKITLDEFYDNEYITILDQMCAYYETMSLSKHPILTNYETIIHNSKYFQIHIAQPIELETGETLAIIKTHTSICILQRKWKTYYKKLMETARKRAHPTSILYRKIHGKWLDKVFT